MAEHSKIEWTDATWNPVRGCAKVSPGCANCYAETFAERFRGVPGHPYAQGFDLRLVPEKLQDPLTWQPPRLIFVNSMSDLFHKDVPDHYILAVASVMQRANWHTYQVLTKRSERLARMLAHARPGALAHDATPGGTALVADLLPGAGGSSPASLVAVDGVVYFAATDGSHGRELWRSDGSASGTWLVEDLAPGSASSSPAELTPSGGRLYFSANGNGAKGEILDRQLWALALDCLPGEVPGLTLSRNGASAELAWTAVDGATAYDVVRATSPAGFASGAACLPAAGTTASDPALHSPAFYYLVRARNACGPGPAGLASAGSPRDVIDCP